MLTRCTQALAAEMTAGFSSRLASLGIVVKELTGDMQLTKQEIEDTQIIVTTPEKWDVITRKSTDSPLTLLVHLLILDEVHLLNEDRGPVIETLVARTLRQVESTQSMIRIVGLSATLPNYKDVAQFMRVNESTGLHYFDASYRPVPLEQTFVGVKGKGMHKQRENMTKVCYDATVKVWLFVCSFFFVSVTNIGDVVVGRRCGLASSAWSLCIRARTHSRRRSTCWRWRSRTARHNCSLRKSVTAKTPTGPSARSERAATPI